MERLCGQRWAFSFKISLSSISLNFVEMQCAALIHRYSYTLGSSPAAFESIRHGGSTLSAQLDKIDTAFVALNDDVMGVSPSSMRDVDERLETWFERTWPDPSPWERAQ